MRYSRIIELRTKTPDSKPWVISMYDVFFSRKQFLLLNFLLPIIIFQASKHFVIDFGKRIGYLKM